MGAFSYKAASPWGAFSSSVLVENCLFTWHEDTAYHIETFDFDASRVDAHYGNSNTVQPDAIALFPQIKC